MTTTTTRQDLCRTCQTIGCIGMSCTENIALAWAKASAGIPLVNSQRRIVAVELARRASQAESDIPTTGEEWRILRAVANCPAQVSAFLELVQAYTDWQACQDNVESWRHEVPRPMSSDAAFDYVNGQLDDAVTALLGPIAQAS